MLDTLPIPWCGLKRYKQRHIFSDDVLVEPQVGYCASKGWYYFEVKGGLRITANGMIVHTPLLPARPHDSQHREVLLAGLPAGATALADKAFLDEAEQIRLPDQHGLLLLTPLRTGMQPTGFQLPTLAKGIRQLIETVNAQLVERFKVQNLRVRKGWTLLTKWDRKILAHTVCVFLNLQYGPSSLDFTGLVSIK